MSPAEIAAINFTLGAALPLTIVLISAWVATSGQRCGSHCEHKGGDS